MTDEHADQHTGGQLAQQWRDARVAVLELVAKLPETRASRPTDRPGWTLKHELAHLLSLDEELRHFVVSARAGSNSHHAVDLRRIRGQAMHAAQEMRLGRLREQLAVAGEATAVALEEAGEALSESVRIAESESASIADIVRARLQRAQESLDVFHKQLG